MTDLTDDHRRGVRSTARTILDKPYDHTAAACELASFVLATVDAPEPTLADEIRGLPDFTMSGENCINDCHERADTLATRVEQMGQDAEDRQEWNRRITEQNATLTRERDEARAEVERLTSVNEEIRRTDNYREFRDKFLTVQKGAESNAETPDPADVKPGEAWKAHIWFDGVRQPGTAIKSAGSSDWVVVRDDGSRSTFRMNEYVELVSRLVPAPRVIANPDDLDRLAEGAVVLSLSTQYALQRRDAGGEWYCPATKGKATSADVISCGPVTVLWEPEA